jgi:hypothetical protein
MYGIETLIVALVFAPYFVLGGPFSKPIGCTTFPNIRLGVCSGKGHCVLDNGGNNFTLITEPNIPKSQCICFPGWTGVNDFVTMEGRDCGQNIAVIYVLWSIILIAATSCFVFIFYKLYQCYLVWKELEFQKESEATTMTSRSGSLEEQPPTRREPQEISPPTSREPLSVVLRWPVVTTCLISLIVAVSQIILALIRLRNPLHAVGVYPASTFLLVFGDLVYSVADRAVTFSWLEVRGKLLKFTSENEEISRRTLFRFKQIMLFIFVLDIIRALLALLIHPFPDQAQGLACSYYTILLVAVIVSTVGCVRAGKALENILMDGLESLTGLAREEREVALRNIRKVVETQKKSVLVPCIVMTLLGWWPFIRAHISYSVFQLAIPHLILITHLSALQPPTRTKLQQQQQKLTKDTTSTAIKTGGGNADESQPLTTTMTVEIVSHGAGGKGEEQERTKEIDFGEVKDEKKFELSSSGAGAEVAFDSSSHPLKSPTSREQVIQEEDSPPTSDPSEKPLFNPFR